MPIYAADRMTVHYSGPLGAHRMNFWKVGAVSSTVFRTAVRQIVQSMAACQYTGTVWTNADYQLAGENFSTPTAWVPVEQETAGINPGINDTVGEYVNFVGRASQSGKRVRLFLFEVPFGPGPQMRIQPGMSALLDAVVSTLDANGLNVGAIDARPVVWKTYMNVGINDYWVRQARTAS